MLDFEAMAWELVCCLDEECQKKTVQALLEAYKEGQIAAYEDAVEYAKSLEGERYSEILLKIKAKARVFRREKA